MERSRRVDRKIKGEGRVAPKSRNLLGTGRPSVTSVATGLFAVATALVAGVVLPLTSVARLDVSPSAPLELYRTVDPPLARGALVVTCVPVATPRLPQRAGPPRPRLPPRAMLSPSLKRVRARPTPRRAP